MHSATGQAGVAPPKSTSSSSPSPPKLDATPPNPAGGSTTPTKGKKRERSETSSDANKRERSVNPEDGDAKSDHSTVDEFGGVDKDGLTSVAGVEKLVAAMQQDRTDGSRKPGYCPNRRSVLAAAVLGTENNDLLDRFVQLGGVAMFHEWLQEAYRGKSGDGESPKDSVKGIDELLITVLSALEKLPVDLQALRCQIGKSVNNLKSHKNAEIKEKARKLVETWKKRVGDEMNSSGAAKVVGHNSSWSTNLKSPTAAEIATQTAGTANGAAAKIKIENSTGQSNGQTYNGAAAAAAAGSIAWKDDAKSSSGSKTNSSNNHRQNKGSVTKENTSGKPVAAWAREKPDCSSAPESGSKVVVRLPRSSVGINEEVFGPGSQGSSPSLPDQAAAAAVAAVSSIADASDSIRQIPIDQVDDGKEQTTEKTDAAPAKTSEASSNDKAAVSMAIVPVSAISRISGDLGLGASGRSTVVSDLGTVDQVDAAGSTADRAENNGGIAESKEESRRDLVDGANCASSSSETVEIKGQVESIEAKDAMSSAAAAAADESRPRLELEGLGESPEPRCSTTQAIRRVDAHTKPADGFVQAEKRSVAVSVSVSAESGRGNYEAGPGRGLDSWEKRSSFFLGKNNEAESRKNPAESGKNQETKKVESSSEFLEDDALEVAQQIAKEVEQEMETSHLSSTKDDGDAGKEPDSSPRCLLERPRLPSSVLKPDAGEVPEAATSKAADVHEEIADPDSKVGTDLAGVDDSVQAALEEPDRDSVEKQEQVDVSIAKADEEENPNPAEATAAVSRPDFDLNEGLGGDEGFKDAPVPNAVASASAAGPTTPIPVLPTTKGAYIPPESLRKGKSEPGWRGSAATSAFRPAEPRRINETQQQQHQHPQQQDLVESHKQPRQLLDIDLNIADDSSGLESPFLPKPLSEKPIASTSGRIDFDLNCADSCDDGAGAGTGLAESSGYSRTTASAAVSTRGMTRDFDLNGPVDDEEPSVQHVTLRSSDNATTASSGAAPLGPAAVPGFRIGGAAGDLVGVSPWYPSGNSSAVAIPALPVARAAEAGYQQPFLNAGGGGIHFNMDLYRAGMTLATPAVPYPGNAPVPYPYAAAGFPFTSNYTFNTSSAAFPASSFVEAPGSAPSYQSQLGGGPGAMSRFMRPHLMGIAEAGRAGDGGGGGVPGGGGGGAWVRPSLDLNTGPEVVAADDPRRGVALEDHLRGFGQVPPAAAAAAAQAGKRKEPDSGWEAFQAGYKQPAWC